MIAFIRAYDMIYKLHPFSNDNQLIDFCQA